MWNSSSSFFPPFFLLDRIFYWNVDVLYIFWILIFNDMCYNVSQFVAYFSIFMMFSDKWSSCFQCSQISSFLYLALFVSLSKRHKDILLYYLLKVLNVGFWNDLSNWTWGRNLFGLFFHVENQLSQDHLLKSRSCPPELHRPDTSFVISVPVYA